MEEREKGKEQKQEGGSNKEKTKSSVKIEEINAVCVNEEDGDILLTSALDYAHLVATDGSLMHEWIIDSGASFHVTPHREWFTTYDASRKGKVRLGNDYACEIVAVGDVQLKFQSGAAFTLKNMQHVPKLTKCLSSPSA